MLLPKEAQSSAAALALADHRMYASKGRGRISAGSQSGDVLTSALRERQPELYDMGKVAIPDAILDKPGPSG